MNKEILEKTEALVTYIENSNTYKDYQLLKEKLAKHQLATNLITEIKDIQKQLVKKEYHHEPITELENILKQKQIELEEIPLYCDFLKVQSELNDIFYSVKHQLEEYFDKKLN